MTTQEILKQCTIEGMLVKLPELSLDRKDYLDVKSALELIGGKWKGGKTQGFIFEQDPAELLEAIANGEKKNLKKEFQFFPTPADVADKMMDMISFIQPYHKVLEPSAGDGALIKRIRALFNSAEGVIIDCFELMDLNRMKLAKLEGVNIIGDDFLQCDLKDTYDIVVANPPFTGGQDIDHIGKMWEVLKPGGTIVTLASPSWTFGSQKKQQLFRDWLKELSVEPVTIAEGSFKESGTSIQTVLLTIVKPLVYSPVPWQIKKKGTTTQGIEAKLQQNKEEAQLVSKNIKVRCCRVCGCTEDNCKQCIEKTGNPCHWVEKDLCSACQDNKSPDEILTDIEQNMKESNKIFGDLRKILSSTNNTDMDFFKQLAALENVDLTLRIMKKNDRLTINVMPGSGRSNLQPIIVTGTGQELDEEFFPTVFPEVEEIKGLITNLAEVKKEASEKKEAPKASAAKSAVKKKEDKKKGPAKKAPVAPPDIFATPAAEENSEEVTEENDETTVENETEETDE